MWFIEVNINGKIVIGSSNFYVELSLYIKLYVCLWVSDGVTPLVTKMLVTKKVATLLNVSHTPQC